MVWALYWYTLKQAPGLPVRHFTTFYPNIRETIFKSWAFLIDTGVNHDDKRTLIFRQDWICTPSIAQPYPLTICTDKLRLITYLVLNTIGFILSAIEHSLSVKQRKDVEAHLANYNIPLQILQMVAEQCECAIETRSTEKELARKPKLPL